MLARLRRCNTAGIVRNRGTTRRRGQNCCPRRTRVLARAARTCHTQLLGLFPEPPKR